MENGGDAKLGICVKNKEFIIMECNIFFTNHTCERFPHFLILYAIFKVIQLKNILFKLAPFYNGQMTIRANKSENKMWQMSNMQSTVNFQTQHMNTSTNH